MNTYEKPIEWVANERARTIATSEAVSNVFPTGVFEQARSFHRQIPGYRPSPLRTLPGLAAMLSVGGVWVKDESQRLNLNSFKVLGGSFAIYQFIRRELGLEGEDLSYDELVNEATRERVSGGHPR